MAEPKLIKVCLTNKGEDTETPWAHDLGAAAGPAGSRKVKLVNVPFMHAKPTWGDVIVVSPVPDGFPTWDRNGAPWKQISGRIVEDGGRWAMIVDYAPRDVSADAAFQALGKACDAIKVVCEGAWGPRDAEPGRVYLAVQKDFTAEMVMQKLEAARLPCRLIQVHPEPNRGRASPQLGNVVEPARGPATSSPTAEPTNGKAANKAAGKRAADKPIAAPPALPANVAKAPVVKVPPPAKAAVNAPTARAGAVNAPAARPAAVKPVAQAAAAKAPAAKAPPAKAAAGKAPPSKPTKATAGKPAAKNAASRPEGKPATKKPGAKKPAVKKPAVKKPGPKKR